MITKGTVKFLNEQGEVESSWELQNVKVVGKHVLLEDDSKCGYVAKEHDNGLYVEELKLCAEGGLGTIVGTIVAIGTNYVIEDV